MTDPYSARPPWPVTPVAHHRRYVGTGLWPGQTIVDLARERAAMAPDAPAIIEGDVALSRARLLADAQALAASLVELGLVAGEVISFQTPNWAEAAILNLAACMAGLVVNPIVPIYRDAEVGQMLADSGARAFFVAGQHRNFDFAAMAGRLAPQLPALVHVIGVRCDLPLDFDRLVAAGRGKRPDLPRVDPGAVKLLLYTSGTTGRPKGVLHSHDTLMRISQQSVAHWGVREGDAIIMPSPVTHISGYANGLELPLVAGTTSILMTAWDATEAMSLIKRHDVAGTVAATPFLTELAECARARGERLPSLRFFACGGAAVAPDVIPAARAAFENCQAFRVFGSSEVPLVTFGYPGAGDAMLAATTDGAVMDYEVRIVDERELDLPEGAEGEILARGPAMFMGYLDPGQTAEALSADGYFRTGDIGRRTPEGAIVITGRKKDIIIRGGENISAKEIEDVLHSHDAVKEASVVAMPHARLGEGVCAYVILRAGAAADSAALAAQVAASGLARQKIPERFVFVDDFPRTASGKIRKDLLRADIRARIATSP